MIRAVHSGTTRGSSHTFGVRSPAGNNDGSLAGVWVITSSLILEGLAMLVLNGYTREISQQDANPLVESRSRPSSILKGGSRAAKTFPIVLMMGIVSGRERHVHISLRTRFLTPISISR